MNSNDSLVSTFADGSDVFNGGANTMMTDAFLKDFHYVATIGAAANKGVLRLAATTADGQARAWFVWWIKDAGYTLRVDGIGNMSGLVKWLPGAL